MDNGKIRNRGQWIQDLFGDGRYNIFEVVYEEGESFYRIEGPKKSFHLVGNGTRFYPIAEDTRMANFTRIAGYETITRNSDGHFGAR